MSTPLHVLILDDSEEDALLLVHELQRGGFDPTHKRVDSAPAMLAALAERSWDLILSDFSMPAFNAVDALKLLHDRGLNLPFIIVSGIINEVMAVDGLKAGAHDFVTKGNTTRLVPAIQRELREAQSVRLRQRAEERLATTMDAMIEGARIIDFDWRYLYVNPAAAAQGHKTTAELLGHTMPEVYPGIEETPLFAVLRHCMADRVAQRIENEFTYPDGSQGWFDLSIQPVTEGLFILSHDTSQRRHAEAELAREKNLLRTLIDNVPDFIYAKDTSSRFTLTNLASAGSLGRTPEEVVGKTDFDLHPPELAAQFLADEQAVMQSGQPLVDREEMMYENGQERWQLTTTVPLRDSSGQVTGLVGISRNITARRQTEKELQQRLAELEAVNRVSVTLRTTKTLDEMVPLLLSETVAVLHGTAGTVWLYDPTRDEVRLAYEQGWGRQESPVKRGEGIPGHVVATGQTYVSRELKTDPHTPDAARASLPDGRGGACVPIRHGNTIIGVLYVNTDLPHEFSAGDVRLLTILTEMAGGAINRMQLLEQTERRLSQLSALRAIDEAITSSLDLRLTLDLFLEKLTTQLHVDAADVLLLDRSDGTLNYAAGRGFHSPAGHRAAVRLGEGHASQVVLERQMISANLANAPAVSRRTGLLGQDRFIQYLGVPLIAKGQVMGALEMFHRSPLHPDRDWLSFLEALAGQAAIAVDNAQLFEGLQRSKDDLQLAYDATIEGWARALDLRDKETEGHSRRVTELSEHLARSMGLSEAELVHLRRGALLHDIGKMGVPDHILLKPGPLSDDEWGIMRRHPVFAYEMLEPIRYLHPALAIPYCHHEKWQGTGYPRGLKADQIPLAARLFAVVDVWDALRSDRTYRRAWPAEQVQAYIREQAGTHFDPAVVEAFVSLKFKDER